MPDYRHVISEEARMKTLRRIVDECAERLRKGGLSRSEGLELIESTRRKVLGLFPDKEEQFELIYRSRFMRILAESSGQPV
jgi:hypothetical protein